MTHPAIRNRHQAVTDQAIAIMRADLTADHHMADLAHAVHMSHWHFVRVFAAVTGTPPGRYLAQLRMAEAARLLAETNMNVAHVATAVGYSSVGTFSGRFTHHHGCPPSVYRQRARAGVEVGA